MRLLWPGPVQECIDDQALIELYRPRRWELPWLRVNFVASVDGAVTIDGHAHKLSGPEDKRVFRILRTLCDALIVGAGTFRQDGYGPLNLDDQRRRIRGELGLPANPPLVVVSAKLAFSPEHPALVAARTRPIVLTTSASPPDRRAALSASADVIVAGENSVDFTVALAELHARGLRQLLCEGGPHVLGDLVAADLVDELCLTVSPLLVGGEPGRMSAGLPTPAPRKLAIRHILLDNHVLLLRYTR